MPRLIILGPDGCGKDTLARSLTRWTPLRYPEPTSLTWARGIPEWQDGRDIVAWWEDRRNHRDEWIDAAHSLMENDGITAIGRIVYRTADLYVGLRHPDELYAHLAHREAFGITDVVWCWNRALTTHHGTSLTAESSADMCADMGIDWHLTQPTVTGAERLVHRLYISGRFKK